MAKNKSVVNSQGNKLPQTDEPYIVLARKYRPQTFNDLIGQDTMVKTLRNAFSLGRIAQAYMLTGVRGVGKTTTARILARALNYETDDVHQPSVDLDKFGRHCREIIESRHPDVLEMDAASNTGIDNIREVIESSKYKPILARTKVFIIDEVHMLSKGAFNALLKTLEEPPEHVKFIFATTEIRKVPVTVLSRCQRFDLRRVDVINLANHLGIIGKKENAKVDEDALRIIARAAGGSVRDALSIFDQAITLGSGTVTSHIVREMLGFADRERIFDLLEFIVTGKTAEALKLFSVLYDDGAEPSQLLADFLEVVHLITRCKILKDYSLDNEDGLSETVRQKVMEFANRLSIPVLSRLWQMSFKGLEELYKAPNTKTSTEMVLIRLTYASDLPPPDEIIKVLGEMRSITNSQNKTKVDGPSSLLRGLENQLPHTSYFSSLMKTDQTVISQEETISKTSASLDYTEASLDEFDGLGLEEDAQNHFEKEKTSAVLKTFSDVVELAGIRRDARLRAHLEEHISLVKFDPIGGSLDLYLLEGAPPEIANELREKLNRWTGRRWMVLLSKSKGDLPIGVQRREQQKAELEVLKQHPSIDMLLKAFPNSSISNIRKISSESEETGTG